MKYSFLGETDIKVSNYCLGTMTFGEQTNEEVHTTTTQARENVLRTKNRSPFPYSSKRACSRKVAMDSAVYGADDVSLLSALSGSALPVPVANPI